MKLFGAEVYEKQQSWTVWFQLLVLTEVNVAFPGQSPQTRWTALEHGLPFFPVSLNR